jgi:V8-like Glu-specific endopeptidase
VTRTAPPGPRGDRVGALFEGDAKGGGKPPGRHFCTASVVHSPGRDLVVTAAHCVDGDGTLWFAPGYRDGTAPYGVWKVRQVLHDDAWDEDRDEDDDVAFAVLQPADGQRHVEDAVGANTFATGRTTGAGVVTVTGYPDAHETPITCADRPTAHSATQQRVDCPSFTGGTSGSPWVNGAGEVVGVIGGYEEGGSTADVSYSVVMGEEADRLYRTAVAQ